MKHIKTFNESDKEEYYTSSNLDEYKSAYDKEIEFTQSEKDKISNLVKDIPGLRCVFGDLHGSNYISWIYQDLLTHIKFLYLVSCPDEWYYVRYTHTTKENSEVDSQNDYYKCDQLDGLLMLLNDKIIDVNSKLSDKKKAPFWKRILKFK